MKDHDIKGLSIVIGKDFKYIGTYIKGVFHDNCELYDTSNKTGWGIKFDIFFAPMVRPLPRFWKWQFWKGLKGLKIYDIPVQTWDKFFGKTIADKLRLKKPAHVVDIKQVHDYHFNAYNPWKGKYWIVFRLPSWIPKPFIAIGTSWKSIYLGFKTSKIEPFYPDVLNIDADCNDVTWCSEIDVNRAKKCKPTHMYRSAILSATIRNNRD